MRPRSSARSRATVQRYVAAFREGGLEGLRQWNPNRPVSEMAAYRDMIRESFRETTRLHRGRGLRAYLSTDRTATQSQPSAKIPQGHGSEVPAGSPDPRAAQKNLAEHIETQAAFHDDELKPRLDAAQVGDGHVFFVDAAHFVFGTFLCCLWSFQRIFVRAASGRQRFNVLGAWNAVTRELIAVTNTTVVNTETMCELLRKIAALGLTGPITLVLDNARYQRNAVVQALATQLGITLLYLPSYSPNLNLIERLWKFIKRRRPLWPLSSEFRSVSSLHPRGSRRSFHHSRRKAEVAYDAQFPAIRRCFTHGRVRYISLPSASPAIGHCLRPAILSPLATFLSRHNPFRPAPAGCRSRCVVRATRARRRPRAARSDHRESSERPGGPPRSPR